MKRQILAAALALTALVTPALASGGVDQPAHFKGKPADTLQQAVANFAEYNRKLKTMLDGEVTDLDMAQIHQLTYTLENALKKINEETTALATTLEEVHLASEQLDREAVLKHGREYLSVSNEIVR